jgi:hypothetical protein
LKHYLFAVNLLNINCYFSFLIEKNTENQPYHQIFYFYLYAYSISPNPYFLFFDKL